MLSCIKSENSKNIDLSSIKKEIINLSEFSTKIEYIKLDNIILLRDVYNLKFSNNYIYIKSYDDGLMQFNLDGGFVKTIGTFGKNQKTYDKNFQFAISPIDSTIIIYSINKVKVYSENNRLLNQFTIDYPMSFTGIDFLFPEYFCLSTTNAWGKTPYYWIILNKFGKTVDVKKNAMPYDLPCHRNPIPGSYTFINNRNLYYFEVFNDTLYHINDTCDDAFLLFKHKRLTHEIYNYNFENTRNYHRPLIIEYARKRLFIMYYNLDKIRLAFFSNRYPSGVEVINSKNDLGFENDFDGGVSFYPKFKKDDDWLVMPIESYQLKEHVSSAAFKTSTPKYPKKKKELEKLANSLKEDDNPVLMLVKLKNEDTD